MNLSLISVSRRARVLAVVAIFGSLTAIRSSLSAAEPRHEGSAVAGQRPHESPSTVFERDPAVELYVDLDLLARAVREQDPAGLADAGLQLTEAERILLRSHKGGLTAAAVMRKAATLAARKHDQATLDRLASAAQRSGNKEFLSYIGDVRKLPGVDDAPPVLVDEVSLQQFALLRDLRHQLGLAELLNEPERIKTVELRMGIGKRLPLAHNEALARCVTQIREGLSKKQSATEIALAKLAAPNRDLTNLNSSQWNTQFNAPDGTVVNYLAVINVPNGSLSLNGTSVGTVFVQPPAYDSQSPWPPGPTGAQCLGGLWTNTPDLVNFTWHVSPDGTQFTGVWSSERLGNGTWTGQRIDGSGANGGVVPDPSQGGGIVPDPGQGGGATPDPAPGVVIPVSRPGRPGARSQSGGRRIHSSSRPAIAGAVSHPGRSRVRILPARDLVTLSHHLFWVVDLWRVHSRRRNVAAQSPIFKHAHSTTSISIVAACALQAGGRAARRSPSRHRPRRLQSLLDESTSPW